MTQALFYLRSATGNQAQTQRQEADCRAYLRERDLLDVGTVTPGTDSPLSSTPPPRPGPPRWSSPTSPA